MIVEPVVTRRWTAGPTAGGRDGPSLSFIPLLRSSRNGQTDRTEPTEGSGGAARQRASVRLQRRRRARHSVIPTLTRAVSRSRDAGPVGPLINLFYSLAPRISVYVKETLQVRGFGNY